MDQHVHPRQVVGGAVLLLPVDMLHGQAGLPQNLQQHGRGAHGRVADGGDGLKPQAGQPGAEPGKLHRREKFSPFFPGIGGEEADENHVGGPQHVHVRLGGGEGETVDL